MPGLVVGTPARCNDSDLSRTISIPPGGGSARATLAFARSGGEPATVRRNPLFRTGTYSGAPSRR